MSQAAKIALDAAEAGAELQAANSFGGQGGGVLSTEDADIIF